MNTTARLWIACALAASVTNACSKAKRATTPTSPTVVTPTGPDRAGGGREVPTSVEVRPDPRPSERTSYGPVYFAFDAALLDQAARDELAAAADYLGRGAARIRVEGHTDDRGTTEYNLALGQQRADAVAAYLRGLGVRAARIDTITYGEERPAEVGDDEAAWTRNRRAELVIAP